jgi:nicotinamidase-related amidase
MSPDNPLLDREDCLLVVVDAQEKLMPVIQEHEQVTANILRLVKFAGVAGLPVLFTEQEKLGPTLEEVRSAASQAPAVTKISFDCFGCQDFLERLEGSGRRTLALCGIESHICVCQTALSARARGYGVHVISDAAGSRAQPNWVIALERMRAAGVVLSSTEMFIYEALGRAGTDEFRATLPLVK